LRGKKDERKKNEEIVGKKGGIWEKKKTRTLSERFLGEPVFPLKRKGEKNKNFSNRQGEGHPPGQPSL